VHISFIFIAQCNKSSANKRTKIKMVDVSGAFKCSKKWKKNKEKVKNKEQPVTKNCNKSS